VVIPVRLQFFARLIGKAIKQSFKIEAAYFDKTEPQTGASIVNMEDQG